MKSSQKSGNLVQIWKGNVSHQKMAWYVVYVIAIYGTFLVLSGLLYSVQFTFVTVCVSNLGNPTLNPRGWWLFTVAMVFGAVALIPYFNYIIREMDVKHHRILYPWALLFYLGSIGMAGVGLFNETMGPIHYVFAIFAFGGLILDMLFSIIIMIYRIVKHYPWPNLKSFIITYSSVLFIGGLAIREILIFGVDNPSELFLAEWYAFFFVLAWMFALLILKSDAGKNPK